MIESVELQVISKILTSKDPDEVDQLLSYDETYYSIFRNHIRFILNHRDKYGTVPDIFTFLNEFDDIDTLVDVDEPIEYLNHQMKLNKQRIILVETFNKIKDANQADIENVWMYISNQVDRVANLESTQPMDIIHQAKERSEQIIEFNKKARIPTGFPEIDKLMYGGLSTVEELLLVVARTNTGKSWMLTRMMESAQRHGFPVLYYSPEMQASFLATRFDTWRGDGKFTNSELFRGKYSDTYKEYLAELESEVTPAYVLEDKDVVDGLVNVPKVDAFVKKNSIKLVIVDGLSYMEDAKHASSDYERYKNICLGLFKMSKERGCAVVIAMQANRETKSNVDKDSDGKDPWPNLYNIEGSDHPARIATQAFVLRQVYDKHLLDIRLEKSRNAANQKPSFSYSWDPNTGKMSLVSEESKDNPAPSASQSPMVTPTITTHIHNDDSLLDDNDFDDDDNVEF